jgi:hypothetical protein
MTATAFLHTRRAWAMSVAPERERFSLAMAARDHAYRTMGM